nr:glycosyl transferase [Lachnospiraceae bacterium]
NYIPAMGEFLKATMCPVARVEGSNTFVPLYNMGCINELLGEKEAAISYYKRCGDYAPAVLRLSEM